MRPVLSAALRVLATGRRHDQYPRQWIFPSSCVGVLVASTLVGDSFSVNDESVSAFHQVVVIRAALVAAGGITAIIGITNPRRAVEAERCSGGQLYGVPEPAVELVRANTAATPEPRPQEA